MFFYLFIYKVYKKISYAKNLCILYVFCNFVA